MLRDTSIANAKSRSTCSAARANVIWVATSATSGSTHLKIHITPVLPMLSTPADSAAHLMQFVASYQKSGPGTARAPDGGIRAILEAESRGVLFPTISRRARWDAEVDRDLRC